MDTDIFARQIRGGTVITLHPGHNQQMDTPSHRLEAVKMRLQGVMTELHAPLSAIRVISQISSGLSEREKIVLSDAIEKIEDIRREVRSIKRL